MAKKFLLNITIACLLFQLNFSMASACSLAIHDWKMVFYLKIPLSAPFFPLAEYNQILSNFKEPVTDNIFWLSGHGWPGLFLSGFVHAIPGWPASSTWHIISSGKSVLAYARKQKQMKHHPIIIGSDKSYLKIAFFSDANSDFKCHQLVIMQSNRIRGVFADDKKPWAQESSGMAWISLIFYQLPLPGRIISLAAYPFNNTRISLFEDHSYVENLLGEKLLKRRADLEVDPFSFDFPELPE